MTSPRPDSRYLSTSPITTDISKHLTNLTASGSGGYEATSARTAVVGTASGRSIELLVELDTSTTGVLVDHGNGAGFRIRVVSGGIVEFSDSNGLLMSLQAPSAPVGGSAHTYVVAWSTYPNPLTVGSATELLSEFLVYDLDGAGGLAWDTIEHPTSTISGAGTFTVRGVFTGGVMTLTYANSVGCVRISCRFHTRVETREHFVAQTAAPANVGLAACQFPVPPVEMFAPGMVIGPQYQAAAASMHPTRNRYRVAGSPVWQWMQLGHADGAPQFTDDMRDSVSTKWVFDLDDPGFVAQAGAGWQTPICWLARIQVPRTIEHLLVRAQWATWRTDAMGTTDKAELQFHCADGPPRPVMDGNKLIPQYNVTSYQTIERQINDVDINGLGDNQVFDFVKVERDADGFSWVWVAGRADEGSGSGNVTYQLRSIVATPVVLGDGYGGLVANPWGP